HPERFVELERRAVDGRRAGPEEPRAIEPQRLAHAAVHELARERQQQRSLAARRLETEAPGPLEESAPAGRGGGDPLLDFRLDLLPDAGDAEEARRTHFAQGGGKVLESRAAGD